jgi:sugar phosphate permease
MAARGGSTRSWDHRGGHRLVGFLVYGPYSLLAGVLSVEVRGRGYAATVAGLVDGAGYFAGVLSGSFFGYLLTHGGYRLGFRVMALLTLASAVLCLFLYPRKREPADTPTLRPGQCLEVGESTSNL